MIAFNGPRPPLCDDANSRAADRAALDALLLSEFESDYLAEEAVEEDATAADGSSEEPIPVSAFRPPVLAPEVLSLPATMAERAEMHLAEIGLSDRTLNTLEEAGLQLVGELLARRPDQLLALSQFGPATLEEIYRVLAGIGFHRTH